VTGRQIAVVGSADPDPATESEAEEVGRRLAEAGATVVCGGLGGVMAAACRGASAAGGTAIGIVPGTARADANADCAHVIATGVGEARNLAVVASGDAVIALGGGWGTLSEIALARKLGRAVVALGSWGVDGPGEMRDGPGIEVAASAADAVERALSASG
jgi:uncharacterized protein (TIGR00725 family)